MIHIPAEKLAEVEFFFSQFSCKAEFPNQNPNLKEQQTFIQILALDFQKTTSNKSSHIVQACKLTCHMCKYIGATVCVLVWSDFKRNGQVKMATIFYDV